MSTRRAPWLAVIAAAFVGCADGSAPPPNVVVTTDLTQTFDCAARDCLARYRDFPVTHARFARPEDEATLLADLEELDQKPLPEARDLSNRELRRAIVDALNIGFLLDGLDERELRVTVFEETPEAGFTARRLIFDDPLVGELEALELSPPGDEPVPAVLGLHGHFDTPEVFAERFLGAELAASGYFVLMPQFRAMACFDPEAEISLRLLENGFTIMGLRVYETLLLLKYLRASSRVDPSRIALLTHSGGSSTANLAVYLTNDVAVQVTDYFTDWRDHCTEFDFASIHCETLPALFPLGATLRDTPHPPVPRLVVPYAFESPETRAEIRTFLAERLGAPQRPSLE